VNDETRAQGAGSESSPGGSTDDTLRPDTLAVALALAKFGFHVFPVDHPELPKCVGIRTDDHDPDTCVDRGKHTTCKFTVKATTDPKEIAAMFAGLTRNIGIACGKSGIFVVDEDAPDEFAKICADADQPVPDTFRVKTAKGWHHYFRPPPGVELGNYEGKLRKYEVNVRGHHGYVVAPGSVHAKGHVYVAGEYATRPILPLPQFLIDAVTDATASDPSQPHGPKDLSWWRDPEVIHHPNRHNALISAAGWCLSAGLHRDEAVPVIRDVWHRLAKNEGDPPKTYSWSQALSRLNDAYKRWEAGERRKSSEEATGRTVRLTPASAIQPRPVNWLWQARIPAGEFTITPGRGGLGKSTFHAKTAADITQGLLPGIWFGTPKPVIIAAVEDSWSRTIVPRLMAAGADMDRVFRADVVTEEGEEYVLTLPSDIKGLETEISRIGAVMVSIDPLLSAISNGLDSYKDAEVRQALQPLARMADRTGCAILGNAHFNKSSGADPLSLVMGSAAFGNVARAALGFARDTEDDEGSCVISQVKNNLGRLDLPSLRYRIEGVFIDTKEGPAEIGHLIWLGESERSVADLLRGHEKRTEREAAADWLCELLDHPVPVKEVQGRAKEAGHSWATVRRAADELGVVKTHPVIPGPWFWALSDQDAHQGAQGAQGSKGEHVEHLGEHLDDAAAFIEQEFDAEVIAEWDRWAEDTVGAEVNQ